MKKGNIIYKRFQKNKIKNVSDMNDIEWFALSSDYGEESYGPIVYSYEFKVKPMLLNIGSTKVRKMIENEILKYHPEFKEISEPDFQYSGGKNNFKYHSYVKKYFCKDFDGTIIIDSEVDSEELEGPTEIVLWKNFNTLIKKL